MSGTIAPDLPVWAQWFAALAVPIAALFGVALGFLNYGLSRIRRRDELFDRRFAIFQSFLDEVRNPERFEIEGKQVKRINVSTLAAEAEFVFGPEIAQHMKDVEDWVADPSSKHRFDDIVSPFGRFLRL